MPDLLPMLERSPGVHVSEIIHYLCIKRKHYAPRDQGQGVGSGLPSLRMQLGQALEHAIAHRYFLQFPDRFVQPGELGLDGIFGTPDLFDVIDWVLHEIKLTWLSSNQDVNGVKFWKYWVQIKAYCLMMRTLVGRLHVVHVRGNYKDAGDPVYRIWEQRFTMRELVENWQMLRNHEQAAARFRAESPYLSIVTPTFTQTVRYGTDRAQVA